VFRFRRRLSKPKESYRDSLRPARARRLPFSFLRRHFPRSSLLPLSCIAALMKLPMIATTTMPSSSTLFVYGTLMAPEVMRAVVGRLPPSSPATLVGYVRHPVRHQVYPGLIRTTNCDSDDTTTSSKVLGLLYTDLQAEELQLLDDFEDVQYSRTPVDVKTTAPSTTDEPRDTVIVSTFAYVWINPISELDTSQDWSLEDFCRSHLHSFLREPCRATLDGIPQSITTSVL
jgi:gamma-glutamylcyclotransferase (GGCT)/AIG2-like uncharacterized protein YtfP